MDPEPWKTRARLFVARFWQPTGACMTAMPGSWGQFANAVHWGIALKTGLVTAILAVLISFTPLGALYRHRLGNALCVGCLTAVGDLYSHLSQAGGEGPAGLHWAEVSVTGAVSAALALAGSYLFEDRARRVRALWARWAGRAA
jgi:hypothetical protein